LFLEVAQDIRPRLRLRDKLMEVEKLALMGQMAAGTAHHLNTPLTAMLLQVEMLRQERKSTEDLAELASIEQRIRFCQVFVQNLLRFAHRAPLKKKPIHLSEVLESVVPLFQPNLRLKRVNLLVELDGLHPCRILGDRAHLEVLFSALVSNAVAAMPAGGSIRLHGTVENGHVGRIHVDDEGVGIPEQLLPRVYEPFFTTKPAGQGTGLGLAIARNIVAEHAGTLQLENRPGGGVRAIVTLPLLEEDAAAASTYEGRG
jgi:signal transduction histidine kinase